MSALAQIGMGKRCFAASNSSKVGKRSGLRLPRYSTHEGQALSPQPSVRRTVATSKGCLPLFARKVSGVSEKNSCRKLVSE